MCHGPLIFLNKLSSNKSKNNKKNNNKKKKNVYLLIHFLKEVKFLTSVHFFLGINLIKPFLISFTKLTSVFNAVY